MFIAGIISWIAVGLLVGFIVSKFLDLHGDDPRLGFAVAVGGAIVTAFIYTIISGAPVSPWNLWTLIFASIGAGIGVTIWHTVRSRFVSRESYTRRSSYSSTGR
jgi:uncharacterized membrane protein YeaQ/YmgE (transglycosylase-associated protein family)